MPPVSFVSEPLVPLEGSFGTAGMARGQPGLPQRFHWRNKDYAIAEVLEQGKEHGNCRHGSGERYVRRHTYRVRTTDGTVFHLYFQRGSAGAKMSPTRRWWVKGVEQ